MWIGNNLFYVSWGTRFHPLFCVHTPWWHVVIGRWKDRLFSERHGLVWCRQIGPLRLTIRNSKRDT